MSLNQREQYLKSTWQAYPATPLDVSARGRIYSKSSELFAIQLAGEGRLQSIQFEKKPALFDIVIEGDIVAITKQAEIVLLSPALRRIPSRRLDFDLQKNWSDFVFRVRSFFSEKGFREMRTPTLVSCPGTEPSLDVFSTMLKVGSRKEKLFLPTSPELHLKKILSLGAEKIFEIAPCFRNGEVTARHQPEFLMLEWYRAYEGLQSIREDISELVKGLCHDFKISPPKAIQSYSVQELFEIHCHFSLTPQTTLEELRALAEKLKVDVRYAQSIDDYFFLIFMEKIESELDPDALIFVEKYPPYQAALARLDHEGWGERFEVYWKGLELANAFHELNDPRIQRERFNEDLIKKESLGKEKINLDEEFLEFLEAGMPPASGVALGLERLFMALYEVKQISDLRIFPYR